MVMSFIRYLQKFRTFWRMKPIFVVLITLLRINHTMTTMTTFNETMTTTVNDTSLTTENTTAVTILKPIMELTFVNRLIKSYTFQKEKADSSKVEKITFQMKKPVFPEFEKDKINKPMFGCTSVKRCLG
uniref:Uncharacterized protein LOC111105876 n=1 Tax=Crassostrea virginica TaxID=6565 RepID=A0A8B8AXZ2_CRAVI|nr:uncharacterized protein LOC111105876 [Crassostrea virginica]